MELRSLNNTLNIKITKRDTKDTRAPGNILVKQLNKKNGVINNGSGYVFE